MNIAHLATESVAAADAFFARVFWHDFLSSDLIAFDIPGRQNVIGSILGSGAQGFGLLLREGARAFEDFEHTTESHDFGSSTFAFSTTLLGLSLERRADIEAPFDRILEQVDRRADTAPVFWVKEPAHVLRPPRRPELETILFALRGLLAADDRGELHPEACVQARVLPRLELRGDPRDPTVRVEQVMIAEGEEEERSEIALPEDLAELPRLATTCSVGLPVVPIQFPDERREVRAVVLVDEKDRTIRRMDESLGLDLEDAAEKLFAGLRVASGHGVPGLPECLVFANEPLYRALRRGFSVLGVECEFDARPPFLEDTCSHFANYAATGRLEHSGPCPSPDDLHAWAATFRSTMGWIQSLAAGVMRSPKVSRRYFGFDLSRVEQNYDRWGAMAMVGYGLWAAFDYRAKKRSRTVVEQALDGELTAAQRVVLAAMRDVRPSLYRIVDVAPGDGFELVDVLSDRQVRVHDRMLSTAVPKDVALFARICPAGSYHFMELCGPVFPASLTEEALDKLEHECGLRLADRVPVEGSHLIGRLWPWSVQRSEETPTP